MHHTIKNRIKQHMARRQGPERKLPSVCILHGLAEGPHHSKSMRRLLQDHGFNITKDPVHADIILAHSGGMYLIPANTESKLLMLVGPCHGYRGSSLFLTQLHKMAIDLQYCIKEKLLGWWLYKTMRSGAYIVFNFRPHMVMYRGTRALGKALPKLPARRLAIILHRDDPWSWYLDKTALIQEHPASLISHPGIHDDLWIHPEEYVAILQYLYETRVLASSNQG